MQLVRTPTSFSFPNNTERCKIVAMSTEVLTADTQIYTVYSALAIRNGKCFTVENLDGCTLHFDPEVEELPLDDPPHPEGEI